MKFRMILTALLLPCVVAAQQPGEKAKTEPPANTNLNYSLVLPADYQYIPDANLTWASEKSKIRVNLNLRNASLKEAIKQLSVQTKQEFVLESDVPADARVTVVAKNIRLSTALDMLTDATELNWSRQTVKKTDATGAGVAYHIGKNVSQPLIRWSNTAPLNQFFSSKDNNRWNLTPQENLKLRFNYEPVPKKDDPNQKPGTIPLLKGGRILELGTNFSLTKPGTDVLLGNRATFLSNKPYDLSTTYTLGNTLVGTANLIETRSTFTCPHCKQQVMVIHQHQSPKCEKCGRVFHDDWQFCPFDGAKRPAGADTDWQFCPICGKSIKPDEKTESKPAK